MQLRIIEDQIILSGPVVSEDIANVEAALAANPSVTTAILRNSPGGHAPSGYRVGELFRRKSLTTAVSGYCYSACSRMYLGGKRRIFTDDYPPGATNIGFHGHYDKEGRLDPKWMTLYGLKDWIIRYSEGKADVALVERWTRLPVAQGYAHFFNPAKVNRNGVSAFICQGTEPWPERPFKCEAVKKSALDLGIATSTDTIQARDQAEIRASVPKAPPPSGYAALGDLHKFPVKSDAGRAEFKRYLQRWDHKAFAISQSMRHWAWNSGSPDAAGLALKRCSERAQETCQLFALDDDVVWAVR